jgi:tetratricopeptide (TPR) repeat protein/tRNA A-37 threonylcarbamoyl transferase component Bud32
MSHAEPGESSYWLVVDAASGGLWPGPPRDEFPPVGARLLHFELVEELGRGASARVYLAKQESLANRLVVLKVTTARTEEPQTLARLRHTGITPVYSVHDADPFQVICMPHLGRTTLARALDALPESPPAHARALLAHAPVGEHALDRLGYSDGCLWVIGELAAGLEHAHARGVLHRDVKPANVLLTDDGTPMLLDFNLASTAGGPDLVGGTLAYMAPEHLRAFLGEPAVVDERSDLFSLGVVLHQMLTLELPYQAFDHPDRREAARRQLASRLAPPEPVRTLNPAVSSAVAAILAKLLSPDPEWRYRSARELREDVARHLADRPLRHASSASVRERVAKWRRRNRRLAPVLGVAVAALVLLILPATVIAVRQSQLAARAKEVRRAEATVAAEEAVARLRIAAVEIGFRADPAAPARGLRTARAVVAEYGAADAPGWEERPAVAELDPARRVALRAALAEALVLMARAEGAAGGYSPGAVADGLRWNEAAARLFPPGERPAVLDRLRGELEARRDGRPVPPLASGSDRDIDLLFDGLDLAAADRYGAALPLLARFCDRNPAHFRAWFTRGVCHDALGQHADAAACFGVCLAVVPDFPLAVLNRGLVRLKQQRFLEAETDLTRALELEPGRTVALLNRGLARAGLRRWADAEADYTAALAAPAAPTRLYFLRAQARLARGDAAGVAADTAEGLRREPADAVSWVARGVRRMADAPAAALADFDAALRLAPHLREALLNKAFVLADHLRREADAVAVLDRLLESAPGDVEARAGRGVYNARLGRADAARRDAAAVLEAEPTAFREYQMAGLYAQLARHAPAGTDRAEALRLLTRAVRAGIDARTLRDDPDLDPIRRDPLFERLMTALGQLEAGTGRSAP